MKKILLSVAVIAAVAAVVFGVTTAFFSDTETSTGNTFTAGSLDLKVDSTCSYNGRECVCDGRTGICRWNCPPGSLTCQSPGDVCSCTWTEKNLTANDLFFSYTDIKPGDSGEDTISLTAHDNDAYLCAYVQDLINYENGCTEPEGKVDETCADTGEGYGELQDNIHLKIWYDVSDQNGAVPCDNIWQPEELVLVEDAVIDSNDGVFPLGQLKGDEKTCLGVAWSVPGAVGNIIQSDSVIGDISFYIEQVRNNAGFECPEELPEELD